jgi:hypothetical protein
MIRNIPRLQVRTFVDERNDGMVWVPYKTLIGYNIPNRPIIGRLWEDMSCIEEFASKDEAVKEAKRQAWVRILELFGHVEQAEVEWEVIHNRHHTFVKLTHEDTREALEAEPVPTDRSEINPSTTRRWRDASRHACIACGRTKRKCKSVGAWLMPVNEMSASS